MSAAVIGAIVVHTLITGCRHVFHFSDIKLDTISCADTAAAFGRLSPEMQKCAKAP